MANKIEFNILITGMDQVNQQLNNGSEALENFSKVTKNLARELSQIGSITSLVGASISGPLLLAFKATAKSSSEVNTQITRLAQVTSEFQRQLATAIVPIFTRFVNVVNDLFNAFNSLDPILKNQIIQGALVAGVFLTLSGIFTIIIAKTLSLISNLAGLASKLLAFAAFNPILLGITVILVVIVTLMIKFKSVADAVFNTFQVLFLSLQVGFLGVRSALQTFIAVSLDGISKIFDGLSKIPGPLQEQFAATAALLSANATLARRFAFEDLQSIGTKTQEIGQIITTGQGSWALGFQNLKDQVLNFFNTLGEGAAPGSPAGNFITGFKQGLDEIGVKINDLNQQGINFANTLQNGLATAFSDIILGAKTAKEAFAAFGATLLKALVDFISQWLAFQIISRVGMLAAQAFGIALAGTLAVAYAPAAALASLASFGGNAAPAQAGIASTVALANVLAVPKFAFGAGNIKDDTLGLFNKGEIVVPNSFSDAIRRGDLSISGPGNSGGGGIVFDFSGASFNGITDSLVKDIFTKASENIANKTLAFRGVA